MRICMSNITPTPDYRSDKELTSGVADGDEGSFALLFQKYRSKVFSIAYHLTKSPFAAEEISQEVFTGLWTSRRHLRDVQSFTAYLNTVIHHKTINFLKKESNWQQIILWAAEHKHGTPNDPELELAGKEMTSMIDTAIERLPDQKKLIYRLSRENGMSYREIADQLQISPHTVKNHLIVAVRLLRSFLRHLPLSLIFL